MLLLLVLRGSKFPAGQSSPLPGGAGVRGSWQRASCLARSHALVAQHREPAAMGRTRQSNQHPTADSSRSIMIPPVDDGVLQSNPDFAVLYAKLTTSVLNSDGSTRNQPSTKERRAVAEVGSLGSSIANEVEPS